MGKFRTNTHSKYIQQLVIIKLYARTNFKGSSTPLGDIKEDLVAVEQNQPVGSHKQLQWEKIHQNEEHGMKNLLSMHNKSKSPQFVNIICWQ